jgi:hypothetical protein
MIIFKICRIKNILKPIPVPYPTSSIHNSPCSCLWKSAPVHNPVFKYIRPRIITQIWILLLRFCTDCKVVWTVVESGSEEMWWMYITVPAKLYKSHFGEPLWLSSKVVENEKINEIERTQVRSPPQVTSHFGLVRATFKSVRRCACNCAFLQQYKRSQ